MNGGFIEVTDRSSPIFGAKVEVPKNAVDQNDSFVITLSYQDNLPKPLDTAGAKQACKVTDFSIPILALMSTRVDHARGWQTTLNGTIHLNAMMMAKTCTTSIVKMFTIPGKTI